MATDAEKLSTCFIDAPVLNIPGKPAELTIKYRHATTDDFVRSCVACAVYIHQNLAPGDILIFLPGESDIDKVVGRLKVLLRDVDVIPLLASLPAEDQRLVFAKSDKRKCIVSTNVAETSLTIDGIVYVIDSGLSKQNVYNPRARMSMLENRPISKASANQRAGRAGRTKAGVVFRVYTKESFNELRESSTPDILSENARSLLVSVYAAGTTVKKLWLIGPPHPDTLMTGLQELRLMDFLVADRGAQLTNLGKFAATLSIDPLWVCVIDQGRSLGCDAPMLTLAALHNTQHDIFVTPRKMDAVARVQHAMFRDPYSDHLTMLNAFNAFAVERIRGGFDMEQWCLIHGLNYAVLEEVWSIRGELKVQLEKKYGSTVRDMSTDGFHRHVTVRKALARGLHLNSAMLVGRGDEYKTLVGEQNSLISPKSFLWKDKPPFVVYSEYMHTYKQHMYIVTAIKPGWIADLPAFQDANWPRNFNGGFRMPEIKEVFDAARSRKE